MGTETRAIRATSLHDDAAMRRLAAGETDALRDLMTRHGDSVLNFLNHMTGDRQAAEDLTQETFLRLFRNARSYRSGRGVRPWIFTFARNLALNHKRRRAPRIAPPTREVDPARALENGELQRKIQEALDRIDEPFRSALVLCVVEGLSYEEAAEVCSCSVKTLSSRLARSRARFRELMDPYLQDGAYEGI